MRRSILGVSTALLALCALMAGGAARGAGPANGEIALVRIDHGQAMIVLRSGDGSERALTRGRQPAWSADGTMLAFERNREVWVVGVDGSGERRVAAGAAPAWAPDGQQLVLVQDGRLRIVGLDGSSRDLAAGSDPDWASTGSIAFARDGDIYVVAPDASGLRQVTSGPFRDAQPAWSSDGVRFVFVRDGAVYARSPIGGTAPAEPVLEPILSAENPSWSPDNRYLLFSSGGQVCAARELLGDGSPPPHSERRRLTAAGATVVDASWRPVAAPGETAVILFEPAPLASTLDCDSEPVFTFGAGSVDARRARPSQLVVITFALTNRSRRAVSSVWLTSFRDHNALLSVHPARGYCRRPTRVFEWECKFGTLAPGERVLVEARYRGRTKIGNAAYSRAREPARSREDSLHLDLASIFVCDIVGTPGNDVLRGTPKDDRICGFDGDDVLVGGNGWDELRGGGGNDRLVGGRGRDVLLGEEGADRLFGGGGRDTLDGAAGADWIDGGFALDVLTGGDGADRLFARDGVADTVDGGDGRDSARIDDGLRDRVLGVEVLLR